MLITLYQIKNIYLPFVITFKIDIFSGMSHVNYVNAIMSEINCMTDSIYEALIDGENSDLQDNIQTLIKILKDLQKSHDDL